MRKGLIGVGGVLFDYVGDLRVGLSGIVAACPMQAG